LNQQHFATPAAELQRADNAVVEQRPDELMLADVHFLERRVEELPFLGA
jgi:hypothetical protein